MILPFALLAASSETLVGSYVTGARRDSVSVALRWHLVSRQPASREAALSCKHMGRPPPARAHPAHQRSQVKQQSPKKSSALRIHHFAAKQAPPFRLRSCCPQSFSRNLTSFCVTFSYCLSPHALWLMLASIPFPMFSFLPPLNCPFCLFSCPFPLLCILQYVLFVQCPFFFRYVTLTCSGAFLSTLLLLFLIPPFTCSFCSQQHSCYPLDMLFSFFFFSFQSPQVPSSSHLQLFFFQFPLMETSHEYPRASFNISFPGEFEGAVMSQDLLQV